MTMGQQGYLESFNDSEVCVSAVVKGAGGQAARAASSAQRKGTVLKARAKLGELQGVLTHGWGHHVQTPGQESLLGSQ
eukprot:3197360-Rhodomonas_salina.2